MRCPRWSFWVVVLRVVVVFLTILGQVVAATGLPLPTISAVARKDRSVPFPCQDRPCGCMNAKQCFERCCCFTAAQRVAWAESHGVEAPEATRAQAMAEKESACRSCCEKASCCSGCKVKSAACRTNKHETNPKPKPAPAPAVRWVIGLFAHHCQGLGPTGWNDLPPAIPYCFPSLWSFDGVSTQCAGLADCLVPEVHPLPVVPPPRISQR